jgi:hypothetical protein
MQYATFSVGSSTTLSMSITSLGDFSGSVAFTSSVTSGGLAVSFAPTSLTLGPGSTSSTTITFSAPSTATTGRYNATITATGSGLSRSITIIVDVSKVGGGFTSSLVQFFSLTQNNPFVASLALVLGSFIVTVIVVKSQPRYDQSKKNITGFAVNNRIPIRNGYCAYSSANVSTMSDRIYD